MVGSSVLALLWDTAGLGISKPGWGADLRELLCRICVCAISSRSALAGARLVAILGGGRHMSTQKGDPHGRTDATPEPDRMGLQSTIFAATAHFGRECAGWGDAFFNRRSIKFPADAPRVETVKIAGEVVEEGRV